MNFNEIIFGKKKKKIKKKIVKEEIEITEKNKVVDDDSILEDDGIIDEIEIKEPVKKKEKKLFNEKKVVISTNRGSMFNMFIGVGLIGVNIILLIASTVGWISKMEEKILVVSYVIPNLYVIFNFLKFKLSLTKPDEDDKIE